MTKFQLTSSDRVNTRKLVNVLMVVGLALLPGIIQAKNPLDWTGIYGGVNIGGIFNSAHVHSANLGFTRADGTCNTNSNFSSLNSGLQLGYARQFESKIVLGLELDYTHNFNQQGSTVCKCDVTPDVADKFIIKNQQQGSLRAQVGYATKFNLLPFFMVGGSLANLGINYRNESGDYYAKTAIQPGWLIGAGVEWQLARDWSIRAEYFYAAYNNVMNMKIPQTYGLIDPNGSARVNLNTHNIRVAINYWL